MTINCMLLVFFIELRDSDYILRGLNKWVNKTIVDEAIKEFNITPEQMEEIAKLAMMGI